MIRNCQVCNKEFRTYPSKIKIGRGKYCSKECCLSVTNKALEENGRKTRFNKQRTPHNKQGYTYTISRSGGKKYILIHSPEHPNCSKKGYIREHRLVMEEHLERLLEKDELVHHIDGDTLNNSIDNLMVVSDKEHRQIHSRLPQTIPFQ